MTDSCERHVGYKELARLLETFQTQTTISGPEFANTHPHLRSCSVCRVQFEGLVLLKRKFQDIQTAAPPLEDCRGNWKICVMACRQVALGIPLTTETRSYVDHASKCEFCGPLLHDVICYLSEMNHNISEADREYAPSLQGGNIKWQRALAQRVVANLGPKHSPRPKIWRASRLAIAAAILLVLVGIGSLVTGGRNDRAAVANLLARAYSTNRTLELRLGAAKYAPLRVSQGEMAPSPIAALTSRGALLRAEGTIASQLANHPSDSSWLQVAAQADLLDGKNDDAVALLRRALQLSPHAATLLTDLATALFQRGKETNHQEDFGAAYNYLSEALQIKPADPVSLFNRAVVAEHLFLYQQATADWQEYLKRDSGSEWTEEAQKRANALGEQLKRHASNAAPLLSSKQAAALNLSTATGSDLDIRIEEYLRLAVRSWLPEAFPDTPSAVGASVDRSPDQPGALQALSVLAILSKQQHGDQWLSDLLHGSSSPGFATAINGLARAVQGYSIGDYDGSRQQAVLAEQSFRSSGNVAGALYAELFQTLNDQVSGQSENCRRGAIAAKAESKSYSYPWLEGQFELQHGVCSDMMGDIGTYEKTGQSAQYRGLKAGYTQLYLRATGFVADSRFTAGDTSEGLRAVNEGLRVYWSTQNPELFAHNLYAMAADSMDDAGQAHWLLALRREALAKAESTPDLVQRAEAHSSVASAAVAASQPTEAEHEYAEAARLYALAPKSAANTVSQISSEVRIGQVESRHGAYESALSRLSKLHSRVQQVSNNLLAEIFYSTMGEAHLRSQHAQEAEQAFRSALPLAERNLRSLRSEAARTAWVKDAVPLYLGLVEAKLTQGREQEALDMFEWFIGAPQRVGTGNSQAVRSLPDPARLSAQIPLLTNQTVLAYGILPDGLAIWVYDNRGLVSRWVSTSPQDVKDLATSFYNECSDPASELAALHRDAQALYSTLIAPIESHLDPNRTLVIETDGSLSRLPFEALIDAKGHYLIEHSPIVHSRGLYAGARLRPDLPLSPSMPALVVGSTASAPAKGLLAIPDLLSGADMVASHFHSPHKLEGVAATVPAVEAALPGATVFHFVGHAITSPDHTGLMLDGFDDRTGVPPVLDANLVRHLNLPYMQLAVLAACSTDAGEGTSSGFDSVAGAFEASGVPHVVASRWGIDSNEARTFVGHFYDSILSGQVVSDATRLASRKFLLNPRTAHPYYWAAFAAYGRP